MTEIVNRYTAYYVESIERWCVWDNAKNKQILSTISAYYANKIAEEWNEEERADWDRIALLKTKQYQDKTCLQNKS